MDTLAQFQTNYNPPNNEEELVAYCRALGPVLATLQTAGTEDAGAVQHLDLFAKQTNKATFEQRDQQLSQATLRHPEDCDGLQHQTEVCMARSHQGACDLQRL